MRAKTLTIGMIVVAGILKAICIKLSKSGGGVSNGSALDLSIPTKRVP